MQWYKSFQKQGIECRKTGNKFNIRHPCLSQEITVCVPFKTFCHSFACLGKRQEISSGEGKAEK